MLRERLAHTPAIAPTLELRLTCDAIVRTPAPHGELFPTRASEKEGLTRMLERLQARLGSSAVRTLESHADHRPERATSLTPVCLKTLRPGVHESHPSPPHLTRPVWLWPTPQPLKEQRGRPWLEGHPLRLLAGPERVESGWWDDRPALRDYFIAQAHDESLVWVYRSRLALTPEDSGWFLHGRFA
jgi:protein ImuB